MVFAMVARAASRDLCQDGEIRAWQMSPVALVLLDSQPHWRTPVSQATKSPSVRAAADVVRDCSGNRKLGRTGVYYGDLSVRNISCRGAYRRLRSARLGSSGVVVPGWSCRQIGTYGDGGIYRCTRSRYAMRFSAGG